jgi:hypothetical protein
MNLTLSRDELFELSGYRRPAEQIRWLTKQGIMHFVARDGHPRVVREALLHLNEKPANRMPQLRLT